MIDEFQRVGPQESPNRSLLLELKEAAQKENPTDAILEVMQTWLIHGEIRKLVRDTLIEWYNSLDLEDPLREDILDMAPSVIFPLSRQVVTKIALKETPLSEAEEQVLSTLLSEEGRDRLNGYLTEEQETRLIPIYDRICTETITLAQGKTLRPFTSGYAEALKNLS